MSSTNNSVPIFFIHKGDSKYLKYSLAQAKLLNTNSNIFLLGDSKNDKDTYNVEHHHLGKYMNAANYFRQHYVHLSSNGYEYELFCFQRWFILKEFIQSINYDGSFIYLDSDVLLYCNIGNLMWTFSKIDLTISKKAGPQYLFFKSIKVLEKLCDFITEMYTNEEKLSTLKNIYLDNFKGKRDGGVCDMTALGMFVSEIEDQILDLNIIRNDTVFDHNFNLSEGYEFGKEFKKIYWIDELPYGKRMVDKKNILFYAIHFQGQAKYIMHRYYSGKDMFFSRLYDEVLYILLFKGVYKLINKLHLKKIIKKVIYKIKK